MKKQEHAYVSDKVKAAVQSSPYSTFSMADASEEELVELRKSAVKQHERDLARILSQITENYTNYDIRYTLVLRALLQAKSLGYPCGFRHDAKEPDWPVVTIELPEIGQVSWHMPPSNVAWDGSGEAVCKERCRLFQAAKK